MTSAQPTASLELVAFGLVDPVRERRVDHHDDVVEGRSAIAHGFVGCFNDGSLRPRWRCSTRRQRDEFLS